MILKLQQGGTSGGGMPPFATYTPISTPYQDPFQTQSKATASSSSSNDLGLKDLLGMIKELDGLPNDAAALASNLTDLFTRSEAQGIPLSSSDIASAYTQYLAQIRRAKFNKEAYDNTYKIVKDNGGLNEIAITNQGLVVAQDRETKQIVQLTPEEANAYKNKYVPLTNSNLLAMRAQSADQTFDNTMLAVVENGIGLESVHKLIKDSIANLGTDELSLDGYSKVEKKKLTEGLQYLQKAKQELGNLSIEDGMTIDGLYESNVLTKDQADKAVQALQYVYTMLPQNAKSLLAYKAGGQDKAMNIIYDYITAGTSTTNKWSTKIVKDKDGNLVDGSGNKNIDLDPVKAFVLGKGYQQSIPLNMGNSYTLNVNGRYGLLTDKQGSPLGANSTFEDVTNSAFSGVLDVNNATFGGLKLNTNQGQKILLDSADIIGMDLPVDQDALNKGIIRPDLYMLQRLEQADQYIRDNNISDPAQINEVYSQYDLPPKFLENGALNQQQYRRFARLSGIAEETALPEDGDLDDTVVAIDDENERTSIEEVFKQKDKDYTMGGGFFGWGATELYRGAIYIPVRQNLITASLGSGKYYTVPDSDATNTERKWEIAQTQQKYQKPPTLSELRQ